jgi:hypothetical protein
LIPRPNTTHLLHLPHSDQIAPEHVRMCELCRDDLAVVLLFRRRCEAPAGFNVNLGKPQKQGGAS